MKREKDNLNKNTSNQLAYCVLYDQELQGDTELLYNKDKLNFDEFINRKTSGIGYYRTQFDALCEYNIDKDFERYYYHDISDRLSTLNYHIGDTVIVNTVRRSLLKTIRNIIDVIEYEFEWVPEETINNIKSKTLILDRRISNFIISFDINAIYYMALSMINKSEMEITAEDDEYFKHCINIAAGPYITLSSTEALVIITNAIYDALYESLYGICEYNDFDIIGNRLGEVLILFKNDIDQAIANCVIELCAHRLTATPFTLDNTKELCEEFGIPFDHNITGYLKY